MPGRRQFAWTLSGQRGAPTRGGRVRAYLSRPPTKPNADIFTRAFVIRAPGGRIPINSEKHTQKIAARAQPNCRTLLAVWRPWRRPQSNHLCVGRDLGIDRNALSLGGVISHITIR